MNYYNVALVLVVIIGLLASLISVFVIRKWALEYNTEKEQIEKIKTIIELTEPVTQINTK